MTSEPFGDWLALQRDLQIRAFNLDPMQLTSEERAQFMLWNAYALVDELSEAMQEVGWKPWASSRHLHRDDFIKEMVDLLHFAGNMLLCASDPSNPDVRHLAQEVWKVYQSKHEINAKRQEDGYDGVKDKCPNCKRSYADVGVRDTGPVPRLSNKEYRICSSCGHAKEME